MERGDIMGRYFKIPLSVAAQCFPRFSLRVDGRGATAVTLRSPRRIRRAEHSFTPRLTALTWSRT